MDQKTEIIYFCAGTGQDIGFYLLKYVDNKNICVMLCNAKKGLYV